MSDAWSAAKFLGNCRTCKTTIAEGDPQVLGEVDGKRAPVRCGKCPDLTPEEKGQAERARARGAAKAVHQASDAQRRDKPASSADELTERTGTLAAAAGSIIAAPSIRSHLAAHGLSVRDLLSSFGVLAAASTALSECSVESWIAAADQCARWGLLPRVGSASPVYLVPRAKQVRAEKTSKGDLEILRRAGVCSEYAEGWTFACEARLGELAARLRDPETRAEARAEADTLRQGLLRRAATLTVEEQEGIAVIGWYLQTGGAKLAEKEHRTPIARLGKAIKEAGEAASPEARAIVDILRALLASPPPASGELTPEARKALDAYRLSLEEQSSGLNADEEAMLAALTLPRWEQYGWYSRPKPAKRPDETDEEHGQRPRLLVFDLPDPSLWARPVLDYRKTVPVVWWVRLRGYRDLTAELSETTELAHVMDRKAVYDRAVSGKTVRINSQGLLQLAGDDSPWCGPYHGEMGCSKVLRNAVSRGVVAITEALRQTMGPLVEYDQPGEARVTGIRGVLDRARQIEAGNTAPDLLDELAAERTRQREPVPVGQAA